MTDFTPGNWQYELEDGAFFNALPDLPPKWAEFTQRPDEVSIDWHRTENQGQIGSCQGNDLASCLERLAHVKGEDVQLSRIFGYLATQKLDGLLGKDSGSTIANGVKLAIEVGLPPEVLTGYPKRYPGRAERDSILDPEHYAQAEPYRAFSAWKVPRTMEEVLNFIGGGGAITFGIAWYSGLIPRTRIVQSFNPSNARGGHAMAVLGYNEAGLLRAVNSHGDGPFLIHPNAWLQMLNHRRTRAVGLVGNPEADPVDWYHNSPYFD